jgi:hypothetical protein
LEVRRLWASSELQGYLDFPYAAQVYRLERQTTQLTTGKFRSETVHGVTSLRAEEADPVRLLSLNRAHWSIENGLHYVRDMSFDEDRCRIRKYAGAQVMASLRNLAISLLRLAGGVNVAAALRFCARHQLRGLRLIGLASV